MYFRVPKPLDSESLATILPYFTLASGRICLDAETIDDYQCDCSDLCLKQRQIPGLQG